MGFSAVLNFGTIAGAEIANNSTYQPSDNEKGNVASLRGAGLVPIDDVDQAPVVLSELKLKLALFVDD
jgi:hypothetical protein